jgi:hypothetical protein
MRPALYLKDLAIITAVFNSKTIDKNYVGKSKIHQLFRTIVGTI